MPESVSQTQTRGVRNVTVLGAGVIGLTTALKIQQQGGYQVTVLAQDFPTDPTTVTYASLSAVRVCFAFIRFLLLLIYLFHAQGAHHVSVAGDDVDQRSK